MFKVGIDLGGTKIEIIAFNSDNQICFRKRILQNFTGELNADYQGVILKIANLIRDFQEEQKLVTGEFSVGIGTPGAIDYQGLMKNSNSVCLNGKPLLADLQKQLSMPIKIANDANCFALSEAIDGAGKDAQVVFGVIVGTGCGGGVVVNKQVIIGANSIAGEWGHNPLPFTDKNLDEFPAEKCYCGRYGCIELWLSGTGMARDYYCLNNKIGKKLSAQKIAIRADKTNSGYDKNCEQTLIRYEERMAKSLAMIINILDPNVIVLGGGVSKVNRLYQNVPKLWQKYIFSNSVQTKLLPPIHGDASGVRGAAWL